MLRSLFIFALLVLVGSNTPSFAQAPTCSNITQPGGMGLTVQKKCLANPDTEVAEDDAYYLVEVGIIPESGFGDSSTFDKNSASGKALKGFLKTFFNSEKSTNLDIGLTLTQGATAYPTMSLMNFQLTDDNVWRSSVRTNNRTMLHKLAPGNQFNAQLSYSFSKTKKIDFTPATSIIDSFGVKLATPTISPIITAASKVLTATMQASGVDMRSGYNLDLAPWRGDTAEIEFLLADPNGVKFARVNIRVRGTRSLMASPRDLKDIKQALPTGNVSSPLINLPKELITGQARDWPLLNAALGSTPSLTEVLGKELTKDSLVTFCQSVETGISTSYLLTSFDSVLVRARLIEAATINVRPRINPYIRCFPDKKLRDEIVARLGINTEIPEPVPAVIDTSIPKPLLFENLLTLGCVLKGAAAGDDCGALETSRANLTAMLAPTIEIKALDTLPPSFSDGMPGDFKIGPADFLARFGGKFSRFRNIVTGTQTLILHERVDSNALRLRVFTDSSGKVTGIEIRNIS